LGCDMINVGREAMLAIGCIQAQRCHTGGCPTGVATQSKWLMRGLDPELKSARCANYVRALRGELLSLARTVGVRHPALVTAEHIEIVSERYSTVGLADVFGYQRTVSPERRAEIEELVGPPKEHVAPPGPQTGPIAGDESGTDAQDSGEMAGMRGGSAGARAGD
ncbi:MAG: glutamate synthase-related protein, partial [Actinomycetota bacterium]|nr:glutamate synthase-related protein [Actinomycetota bacterium]